VRAVNLIPADQRGGTPVGAGRSGGAAYVLLGTLVGLALMAVVYGMADRQISSRTSEAATLTARAQQEQAAATRLAPYTTFVALRQARTQAVEALVSSRFDWAHAMHEFGRVLPHDASIATLTGTIGGAGGTSSSSSKSSGAVASATPPGSVPTFTITGCATSQAAVAQTMNRLRLIDGVSGVGIQSSTRAGGGTTSTTGGCTGSQAAYSLLVTFQPLPGGTGSVPATATVASSSSSTGSVPASGGPR
jgi:Tfp pilus assembly protein PilN